MTDKPFSLIDSLLEDTTPDWGSLGLKAPKSVGDQFKALSQSESDSEFLKEIGGVSEHTAVPGGHSMTGAWETKAVREATNDSILSDAFQTLSKSEKTKHDDKALSDKEVENRVKELLTLGMAPSKVAGMINKNANDTVLKVFNPQTSAQFANGYGFTTIEPNAFMPTGSCEMTFDKIKKEGKFRALSVKKIAACDGCSHNHCGNCGLYSRPIVASASELKAVVEAAVREKGIKAASLKEAVRQLHEGSGERVASDAPFTRVEEKTVTRTAGDKQSFVRKEASVEEVGKMLNSGIPLNKIYKDASAQYGKTSAMSAIKRYISGLKQSKAKIILASLDCSFLKGKLATGNAIVGEKKCASCSFRNGMHCGMTGGTLLSFPGMDRVASKHISHEGVKDGKEVLFEFDLLDKKEDSLEYRETPTEADIMNVELSRTSSIDIED